MRRVVVTGIGIITSLGDNKDTNFEAISQGKCGVCEITHFSADRLPVRIAAEIKDFDPVSVMDAKEVKKADRFIQLGLKSSKEAMADAGFSLDDGTDYERFGISSASGIGGLINIEKNSITCFEKGPKRITPFFIPSALSNMLGGFVSIAHGLKGPNVASVTACAAGTHGIIEAYKTIVLNSADRMMVVGSEATICEVGIGGFAAMKALSTRNDDPKTASRPFDKNRDGFVMGEGSATLILEEYEIAKARGAKIYGEIIGFGESGDANHITSPSMSGPLRAMKAAISMAKQTQGADVKIDYINAHGTSTPANDKNETAAIKEVFAGNIPPVSSIKGQIGHCLGAAGTIEAAISLLAMQKSIIPPTINYTTPDLENGLDLDYVPNQKRSKDLNVVMSNSFGFGGTNGVVIFKKLA